MVVIVLAGTMKEWFQIPHARQAFILEKLYHERKIAHSVRSLQIY
jgi:hypothetical protein